MQEMQNLTADKKLEQVWVDIEISVHNALMQHTPENRQKSLSMFIDTIKATLSASASRHKDRTEAVENLIRAFS